MKYFRKRSQFKVQFFKAVKSVLGAFLLLIALQPDMATFDGSNFFSDRKNNQRFKKSKGCKDVVKKLDFKASNQFL